MKRVLSSTCLAGMALVGVLCTSPVTASADTVVQGDVRGSFLVFPKFDIRAETSTQLRIVNNGSSEVDVKLNYVCPGIKNVNEFCAALDTELSFTPHQTRIVDVADQNPPCNQGYVVAFAINGSNHPISYNKLTGSYSISSGHQVEADNAIMIQSTQSYGNQLGSNGKLRFGNGDYVALPDELYTDFRAVASGGEGEVGSRLVLMTLDVLAGMQNPPAVAFIDFWNSAEVPFSTSVEYICWAEYTLDDIDLNFLEDNLGTTYGSMEIVPVPNCPIPGACPPLNPYDAAMLGALQEYGDTQSSIRNLAHNTDGTSAEYQPR